MHFNDALLITCLKLLKHRNLLLTVSLVFASLPALADPLQEVDSLLKSYQTASKGGKASVANSLMKRCLADDVLIDIPTTMKPSTPADSIDMLVWFAAERFYYNNSYFKESLAYIDKALPLAAKNRPDIYATLLCDRGYCLFKTGQNTEAIAAEKSAEQFSKRHSLYMSLARAYNYLAIINLTLGYTDEAKHFVQKAIDTDRLTGSKQNTHNYLGIACEVYSVANEPDMAIGYGKRAVEAARDIDYDAGVVNHLSQLSYAYNRKGNLQQALKMSQEAVATVEHMEVVDRNLLAISLEYVAFNLLDMKRNSEAVPVIRRAIALEEEVGNMRSVCYDHKSLAEALEPDNPREAMRALRRYSTMMDSLHYAEMHEMLSETNAQLHNDELKEENTRNKNNVRTTLVASIVVLLFLLSIIAILVYIARLKTRLQKATERQQASREEFYTNVTHEFRTPLTVIIGMAHNLSERVSAMSSKMASDGLTSISETEQMNNQLSLIERNGQQLLTLVNQLLDISKVSSSVGDAKWYHGNIVGHIDMVVEPFRHLGDIKGVEVRFLPDEKVVQTDFVPDYMQKIVSNLLSNALKFTPSDGSVTVSTRRDGRRFLLSVADTGQGILPEDLPHVFEPFFQGSNNTHTGTGVGLALVRQLSQAVGGEVTAASASGEMGGAVFTVSLPLRSHRDVPSADQWVAPSANDDSLLSGSLAPRADVEANTVGDHLAFRDTGRTRVLVVEDNADVAEYIGSVLADRYDVAYAADGRQGLQQARALTPDLIVTDVMMPGVDGLQLCRQLRSDTLTNHIPIVIITARVTDDDRLQGIEAGADAYLNKPFRADELLLRVQKLLEQRQLLQRKFSASLSDVRADAPSASAAVASPSASGSVADESLYERNVGDSSREFLARLEEVALQLMPQGELTIDRVADEMCMSRSQLSRKLRAVIDTTPSAYILDIRLREVKRLLLVTPPLTLLDIAMRCGFSDHAHMTHTFTRKFGMSPSQYAKNINNQHP